MQKSNGVKAKFSSILFSPFLLGKSVTKKIAYIAVITAFLTVGNTLLEIKFSDVQFSLTLYLSMLAGVILGGGSGFIACVIGDAIGFLLNSWGYLYMPWVGLTSGVTALIAGLVFYLVKVNVKGKNLIKSIIICLLSFLIGTVLINSTGFYFYNYKMGFSTAVIDYVKSVFGGEVTYFGYVAYRLIFKLQILNCLVNYALFIITLPVILKVLPLKSWTLN